VREIVEVVNQLKPYVDDGNFLAVLNDIENRSVYLAPEVHFELWNELTYMINRFYCPPLQDSNEVKVISIFTQKTEDEVKELFCK